MKLAFIVQRYGREILGGAETLARQIAERLARRHDIEVLTTTARDYITWRNEYPEGEEKLRGVRIRRFTVQTERDLKKFNQYSDWIYHNPHTREDELRWLEMQGPVVPQLVDFLRQEHGRYELLIFFTYLYYPTFYGLQIAPDKSVLVPTAHDEPPLALGIYEELFDRPSAFIFNTEAEELLVLQRFGVYKKMRETIGIGMELLDQPDASAFRRRHKLPSRYLLYAGRIDAGKGCEELVRYFRFYKEERPGTRDLHLVFIGKLSMRLPSAKDISYLGFLDEDDKLAAMAGAMAVVVPSRLESLSIVAIEAFAAGTPVIVNAGSQVLVDHCRKANAGLYYSDYEEFEEVLDLLLRDKNLVRGMGRLGQRYIKENFGWEKLLNQYELAFRSSARPPRPAAARREEQPEPAETKSPPEDEARAERPALVGGEVDPGERAAALEDVPEEGGTPEAEVSPRAGGSGAEGRFPPGTVPASEPPSVPAAREGVESLEEERVAKEAPESLGSLKTEEPPSVGDPVSVAEHPPNETSPTPEEPAIPLATGPFGEGIPPTELESGPRETRELPKTPLGEKEEAASDAVSNTVESEPGESEEETDKGIDRESAS